ncbi:hypothetical protein [Seleniivibrio woodruffii]|uniref:hypothetical protein n=1 Tax=Seleniivibrio woodruffii TaxID=1078050 RepID=UPI001049B89F|nr:hypothetical protein [Seleniivibrio woodruffii]
MVNIHNPGHRNKATTTLTGPGIYTIHMYPDPNFSSLWDSGDIITIGPIFTIVPRAFNVTQQTSYEEAVVSEMALHLTTFYETKTASYFWDSAKSQWVLRFELWEGSVDGVEVFNTDGERIVTSLIA